MLTAQERVANGVQFLNEKMPGWVDKINLDTLDVSSFSNCILGQLFGGFTQAVKDIFEVDENGEPEPDGVITARIISLGFDKSPREDFGWLTNVWEEYIYNAQHRVA